MLYLLYNIFEVHVNKNTSLPVHRYPEEYLDQNKVVNKLNMELSTAETRSFSI